MLTLAARPATLHREQYHWRLVYPGHTLDEPEHDVSIREPAPGAIALQVVDAAGRELRTVDLRPHWLPIFYRCRSFKVPGATRCIVVGRALPLDDEVRVEIEAIYQGRWTPDVPPEFIDRLAIATQVLRVKG